MDFLDPKKQRAHSIQLIIGYVLIGIAVLLGTTVLLYQAYGFSLHKGKVVQNGLIFVSSQPKNASIYLNGKLQDNTNARIVLEAGTYTMKIQRGGYRTWQRAVTVEGGMVQHFDYPFLIPNDLKTTKTGSYKAPPSLALQSPDRRWLLVAQDGKLNSFDRYDIKDSKKITHNTVAMPENTLTSSTSAQKLKLVEWSNDNRHVLLQHVYGTTSEYVMFDTQDPSKSVNLTTHFKAPSSEITLQNKVFDRYFLHDTSTQALSTAKLNEKAKPMLQNVLAYKSYGNDTVLYSSAKDAAKGEVNIMLHQGGKEYKLRSVAASQKYLLDLTRYSGSWFVAAGSTNENRVYVYKDPVSVLGKRGKALTPVDVLKVKQPTYLAFSANTQFVMAENATHFAVYDAEYDKDYTYNVPAKLDAPQMHATWMDGDRLTYVSRGKVVIFDYDSTNLQPLMAASPAYQPFFAQNYRVVYGLVPQAATAKTPAEVQLTGTALLTSNDQ